MKCRDCKHIGWGHDGDKPFFGWCRKVEDSPELDRDRKCRHFAQATNGDRIRNMSDEQLADLLCAIRSENPEMNNCAGCVGEKWCRAGHAGMIDWLQKQAEEDV